MKKSKTHTLVYCLAGKGSRFLEEGISVPKFLLKLSNNKSILETSLNNLYPNNSNNLILILNNKQINFENEILEILNKITSNYKIKFINDNNGQAETANESIELIKDDNWIYFFNGDTILLNRNLDLISNDLNKNNNIEGFIDVFLNDSNKYSYVEVKNDFIVKIKEKEVISNYATTGLYGFKNRSTYVKFFKKIQKFKNEIYISSVYDKMLNENKKIVIKDLYESNKSIILGTPEEYNSNKNLF